MNVCICGIEQSCDLCLEYGRPDGLPVRPTQEEWNAKHRVGGDDY